MSTYELRASLRDCVLVVVPVGLTWAYSPAKPCCMLCVRAAQSGAQQVVFITSVSSLAVAAAAAVAEVAVAEVKWSETISWL